MRDMVVKTRRMRKSLGSGEFIMCLLSFDGVR